MYSPNAVSMLAHRLRRWPNIETALGECVVFAGLQCQMAVLIMRVQMVGCVSLPMARTHVSVSAGTLDLAVKTVSKKKPLIIPYYAVLLQSLNLTGFHNLKSS